MSVFFGYVFMGLAIAAPIGPVNAAQLDRGIKSGFWHAWLVGLGSIMADFVYVGVVYLGLIQFMEIQIVQAFLWSFGTFVLMYTGIEGIVNAGKIDMRSSDKRQTAAKSFFGGFLISISNPLTILFWLGIYGSILAKTSATYTTFQIILYSFAIFLGLFAWDLFMATVASTSKKFLNSKALKWISTFSGLSLIGFAIYFGIEAFKILFM
ncbi:LysE family transporter [Aciduricibacillus chroicocephali]|uniref:LysE family transporter n=1 Tax=Aciduricibacillus chroicocephali TaxID=3054939 RepID=A0ABY9KX49_9BACI|nr:LysE family transporter [Bacillaceae bacterium 44XB]